MMRSPTPVLAPIIIVLSGIFLLDVMGVFIRILSADYPAQELAVFRNLFGMIPSILLLFGLASWHAGGRKLGMRQWKLALLRGLCVAIAQLCFYIALTKMAFATVSTLAFAAPMIVTALSVPVLGDKVGPWRWAAVLIGFAGVVLVMRPGTGTFSVWALLPLGAAFGYAAASVLVRLIGFRRSLTAGAPAFGQPRSRAGYRPLAACAPNPAVAPRPAYPAGRSADRKQTVRLRGEPARRD